MIDAMELKRTKLFSTHKKLNAKMFEFAGWEMPLEYTSATKEHDCVRKSAGLFDVSHMGEKYPPDHTDRMLHEEAICCSWHIFSRIHYMVHLHSR